MTNHNNANDARRGFLKSPNNMALIIFLTIASYFLLTEHLAHVIQSLPYALLLGCVLLHGFMHKGHGHGHNDHPDSGNDAQGDKNE